MADTQEVTAELEDAINYVEQLLDDWETFKGTIEGRRAIWAAFLELVRMQLAYLVSLDVCQTIVR